MHAEICPVCKGTGKIEDKQVTCGETTCWGCSGKGWVEVQDSIPYDSIPYAPYLPPYNPCIYHLHYPYKRG